MLLKGRVKTWGLELVDTSLEPAILAQAVDQLIVILNSFPALQPSGLRPDEIII